MKDNTENTQEMMTRLLSWAKERYGFSEKEVRSIMQFYGIKTFRASDWWTYVAFLRLQNQEKQIKKEMPERCPMCGAKVYRDTEMDGMFGARHAWGCEESKKHFLRARMLILQEKVEAGNRKRENANTVTN